MTISMLKYGSQCMLHSETRSAIRFASFKKLMTTIVILSKYYVCSSRIIHTSLLRMICTLEVLISKSQCCVKSDSLAVEEELVLPGGVFSFLP